MNESELEYALDVMDLIMKKPEAAPFLDPIDDEESYAQEYMNKIKKPVFLHSIKEKLQCDKYSSIDKWKYEMNLIWRNTEQFYGSDSYMAKLANELKSSFKDIIDNAQKMTTTQSANMFGSLQYKLDSLVKKSPEKIQRFCESQAKIDNKPDMTREEIKTLIKASKMLSNARDARAIYGIIHAFNPNIFAISENVIINLFDVSARTQHVLYWYIKKRFEEEGLEYPND